MRALRAYEEVVDFIAGGSTPASVVAFRPSEDSRQRVGDLIAKEKEEGLSAKETTELDTYLRLEHLMRLEKARARRPTPKR